MSWLWIYGCLNAFIKKTNIYLFFFCVCEQKNSLWDSVLSFHHVPDQTQLISLGSKRPYLLGPLASSFFVFIESESSFIAQSALLTLESRLGLNSWPSRLNLEVLWVITLQWQGGTREEAMLTASPELTVLCPDSVKNHSDYRMLSKDLKRRIFLV